MVLRPDGDATICIGQASHAWITGQIARAWRDVEPYEEVCLAAEQHDVGWAEYDLTPELNPDTGLPRSFMEIDFPARMRIWEPAPHRLESQSLYAALLVSLHGTSLHRQMAEAADYVARQTALQERWIERLGADREQVDRNRRNILVWDALSLALCLRWDPFESDGLELERVEGERFTLAPWPFAADTLTVACEGRRLEGRFDDEPELHAALRDAPIATLRFRLSAAG
jgi:hypothetical protein